MRRPAPGRPWARNGPAVGLLLLLALEAPAAAQTDAKTLYAQNCAACHQETGLGIKGAFPALAKDPLILGPPAAAAAVVLNGRGGMPAFGPELDDPTIAAILSYVRASFGNAAPPLAPAMVASVRSGGPPSAQTGSMQAH